MSLDERDPLEKLSNSSFAILMILRRALGDIDTGGVTDKSSMAQAARAIESFIELFDEGRAAEEMTEEDIKNAYETFAPLLAELQKNVQPFMGEYDFSLDFDQFVQHIKAASDRAYEERANIAKQAFEYVQDLRERHKQGEEMPAEILQLLSIHRKMHQIKEKKGVPPEQLEELKRDIQLLSESLAVLREQLSITVMILSSIPSYGVDFSLERITEYLKQIEEKGLVSIMPAGSDSIN